MLYGSSVINQIVSSGDADFFFGMVPVLHVFGILNAVCALAFFDGRLQLLPQFHAELIKDPLGFVASVHERTVMADPRPLLSALLFPTIGRSPVEAARSGESGGFAGFARLWLMDQGAVRSYVALVFANQAEVPCPVV